MRVTWAILTILLCLSRPALAVDRYFQASDGTRLHYVEAGQGHTVVFVPGWSMPAWIFDRQIAAFARRYHAVAFDPRGQGDSAIPASGYDHVRRGQDLAELIEHLGKPPVTIVGWSLGVLDTLAFLHEFGDSQIASLVLVDNSIGENPPPEPPKHPTKPGPKLPREVMMHNFVNGMFAHPQPVPFIDRLTATALRLPLAAANALLAYPVPRTYWKEAVYSTNKPVLYLVRPKFEGQAGNLGANHPAAEAVVWRDVGHALFVDAPDRFNALVEDFLRRRVWR